MINKLFSLKIISYGLIINSILIFILQRYELFFTISIFFGSLVYVFLLFNLLNETKNIKFTTLLTIGLLGGYSIGTANYIFSELIGDTSYSYGLLDNLFGGSYSFSSLAVSLSLIYFSCGILCALSHKENPIFDNYDIKFFKFKGINILFNIIVLIALISVLTGKIQFQVTVSDGLENVSILNQISQILIPGILPLFILKYDNNGLLLNKIITIFSIIVLMVVLLGLGRRSLIFTIVGMIIAYAIKNRGELNLLKKYKLRNLLYAFIIAIVLSTSFKFLFALRLSSSIIQDKLSIKELIVGAYELMESDSKFVAESLSENSNQRTFILSYLATIFDAEEGYKPLYGDELIYSIKMGIPSIIFPSKIYTLPADTETLVHPRLGIPVFDGPNTIITSGVTDFGYIGGFLYPLILIFINLKIVQYTKNLPLFVVYFIKFRLIYMTLSIEQTLYTFISSGPRDLLVLALIFSIILKLNNNYKRVI